MTTYTLHYDLRIKLGCDAKTSLYQILNPGNETAKILMTGCQAPRRFSLIILLKTQAIVYVCYAS